MNTWRAPAITDSLQAAFGSDLGRGETLAELLLEHLAVAVLRQRIDEAILPRTLEARQPREARGVQVIVRRMRLTGHDECHDRLAPLGIRPPHDGHLGDSWDSQE